MALLPPARHNGGMSGYALDPGELSAASGTLKDLGNSPTQQSSTGRVTPDVGSSSGEVAKTFAQFADELQSVGQLLSSMGDQVRASLREYQTTDDGVAAGYRGMTPR